MVATDTAILPWHRQSLTGSPPPKTANLDAQQALNETNSEDSNSGGFHPFGEDGFSFFDLLDVVNPLQHIPVVGMLYRQFTGDTIDPLPRIAGSTLFFGPVGAAVSGADVVLQEASGRDVGEHVMALLRDEGSGLQTAEPKPSTPASLDVSVVATEPAAAGTDGEFQGEDPITAWARGEIAYRKELAQAKAAASVAATAQAGRTGTKPNHMAWANDPLIAADTAKPATNTRTATQAYETARLSAVAPKPPAVPPKGAGATAPGGGWFAANIMNSLNQYHRQQMALDSQAAAVKSQAVN